MTDVSSTTFGLIIAFLLPGISALFTLSFWIESLRSMFNTFVTSESNVGLFLSVVLFAIALGLQVNVVRWLVFEQWICRKTELEQEWFKSLSDGPTLLAFRAAVDEHYRYHQFWGSMTVVLPLFLLGSAQYLVPHPSNAFIVGYGIAAIAIILITGLAAKKAYLNYVGRAGQIMKGGNDA
jgi:hypothetical protein